eukprot:5783919-Prymnesium_polylepis.1
MKSALFLTPPSHRARINQLVTPPRARAPSSGCAHHAAARTAQTPACDESSEQPHAPRSNTIAPPTLKTVDFALPSHSSRQTLIHLRAVGAPWPTAAARGPRRRSIRIDASATAITAATAATAAIAATDARPRPP